MNDKEMEKEMKHEGDKAAGKGRKKKLLHAAGVLLGLIIVAFMLRKLIANWQEIKPYLTDCRIPLFLMSVALYAAAFLAIGWNWARVLHHMDQTLSVREYLHLHMGSVLAKYIPGGIWNIVGKAYLCSQKGVEKSTTMASIILEYVFQIISSGLFFLFLLPLLLRDYFTPAMMALLAALVLAVCLLLPWGVSMGIRILGRVFKEDLSGVRMRAGYVYRILLRYAAVWLFTGAGLTVMTLSFMKIEFWQGAALVLSYPVSWVTGFLSPSPNGMGVREGMLQLLLGSSFAASPLLLVVLTTRIWTILGEVLAVGGYELYYRITQKRKEEKDEADYSNTLL